MNTDKHREKMQIGKNCGRTILSRESNTCRALLLLRERIPVFILVHLWLILPSRWRCDPEHAADLAWRSSPLLDGLERPVPAAVHAVGKCQAFEVADVGAGQNGLAQLILVGQEQL